MSTPGTRLSRRAFLRGTGLAGIGYWFGFGGVAPESPANDRLQIGIIGTAHRASANIAGVRGEDVLALCDVDENYLGSAARQFPSARRFTDFRNMLDMRGLDAVVISTPDHTHAVATLRALQLGKHVYCEKPLTHTVLEARRVAEAAAKAKVATQLGIQIHAERNYRRVVEWVRAGAIGPVREVHVCCSKSWGGATQPQGHPPVPSTLHYDLWLGPTRQRVYHPEYVPENWRRWWQFGGGTLADMGCHYLDLVHWALDLRHPIRVSAEGPPPHPEATPAWMIAQYEYPARDSLPPVKVSWHDGGKRPPIMMEGAAAYRNGVLFMGDKGMLFADYRQRILLPEARFESYVPPAPTIPDSPGHYQEWIAACKTGKPTSCNFSYGGALTEAVLLGNIAYRAGQPITWDAAQLKVTDCAKAMEYVHQAYRSGWSI